MKAASIINFKGGVGKTTIAFHLACHLAQKSRVLVVDVDHQSSISFVILGLALWDKQLKSGKTVNQIFKSYTNRKISFPKDEVIIKNPMNLRDKRFNLYPRLDLVAAEFELDDTEIDLASTNYANATLSDWEKRTLLAAWLDGIEASKKYDYVLFDCPPATKIVSQNALAASDGYIIPVIPDELSSRGVTHFQNLVEQKIDKNLDYLRTAARVPSDQTPKHYRPATQMAAIAPFIVKQAGRAASGYTNIHTEQLAALRLHWGSAVLGRVGENYIAIPEAVNSGWPVWNYWGQNARTNVKKMMTDICTELENRIDSL